MAQQQTNYYPQTASQHAGDQQWGDNSGAVINGFNNVVSINYYGACPYMQGRVTAYAVQNGGPVRQAPSPAPPGFTHMGHGVQQPPFTGTNVQSHVAHVCGDGKGPFTEQEKRVLRELCSHVVERSNHTRDCINTGASATRKSIDLFISGDEKAAKKYFWRRNQKNKSQQKCRAEKKQQKDQAEQPDSSQQYSANTPVYHQQMQTVDDNARLLHPNVNMDFNGMLLDQNDEGHVEIQMQQEAQQDLLSQEWVQLALDTSVDLQLAL
jgi:hypothetical protein